MKKNEGYSTLFQGTYKDQHAWLEEVKNLITDVGDGEMGRGLKVIRQNHMWLKRLRLRSEKISLTFLLTFTTVIATGIAYAVWQGIKHFVSVK